MPSGAQPGEVRNPHGRTPGARNRRTTEIINKILELGHKDPLVTLSELQQNAEEEAVRATAANMLAPYLHSKLGATPAPPPKIYLETQILLPCPSPKTIEQVNANIWYLTQLKLTGQLDREWGDNLIADQAKIANNLIDEAKLIAAQGDTRYQVIHITGGLPALPGTDITMPQLNGHTGPLHGDEPLQAPNVVIDDPPATDQSAADFSDLAS
jgi:hypothetical protein